VEVNFANTTGKSLSAGIAEAEQYANTIDEGRSAKSAGRFILRTRQTEVKVQRM